MSFAGQPLRLRESIEALLVAPNGTLVVQVEDQFVYVYPERNEVRAVRERKDGEQLLGLAPGQGIVLLERNGELMACAPGNAVKWHRMAFGPDDQFISGRQRSPAHAIFALFGRVRDEPAELSIPEFRFARIDPADGSIHTSPAIASRPAFWGVEDRREMLWYITRSRPSTLSSIDLRSGKSGTEVALAGHPDDERVTAAAIEGGSGMLVWAVANAISPVLDLRVLTLNGSREVTRLRLPETIEDIQALHWSGNGQRILLAASVRGGNGSEVSLLTTSAQRLGEPLNAGTTRIDAILFGWRDDVFGAAVDNEIVFFNDRPRDYRG